MRHWQLPVSLTFSWAALVLWSSKLCLTLSWRIKDLRVSQPARLEQETEASQNRYKVSHQFIKLLLMKGLKSVWSLLVYYLCAMLHINVYFSGFWFQISILWESCTETKQPRTFEIPHITSNLSPVFCHTPINSCDSLKTWKLQIYLQALCDLNSSPSTDLLRYIATGPDPITAVMPSSKLRTEVCWSSFLICPVHCGS